MEFLLTRQDNHVVTVTSDSQYSHTFNIRELAADPETFFEQPSDNPIPFGKKAYQALFPPDTLASSQLETQPQYILFVTNDREVNAIPWEYAYGPEGFIVLQHHFVRGVPSEKRTQDNVPAPERTLYIVAVPSNPLDETVGSLDIELEWDLLKKAVEDTPHAMTLERLRPATLKQLEMTIAQQQSQVVHFMVHTQFW